MNSSVLVKGIKIIEGLSIKGPQTIENLYKSTKLSRSSIYRVLSTLEETGYTVRTRVGVEDLWEVDLKILNLLSNILSRIDLKTITRSTLMDLADKTKEIVQLGILKDKKFLILDVIQKNSSIINVAPVGTMVDIYVCAGGLAIAAYLNDDEINSLLEDNEFISHSERTITDKNEFKNLLKKVRSQGYSIDDQYFAASHRCIGAPIFDYSNNVIAALNISGHIKTITDDKIDELAQIVKTAGLEASRKLGFQG